MTALNLVTVLGLMCLLWLVSLDGETPVLRPVFGRRLRRGRLAELPAGRDVRFPPGLLAVLTTVWGLRLSLYLLRRNWGRGEDRRYRAMRDKHGSRFWWVSLGTVFLLQGAILWFVSLPLQAGVWPTPPAPLWWLDLVGCGLWTLGFAFEVVGDWQLARFTFRPDNHGRVLDRGLWRYTRHPNYFGDFCVWWGLFSDRRRRRQVVDDPRPAVDELVVDAVSGVPLLEKDLAEAHGRVMRTTLPGPAFSSPPDRGPRNTRWGRTVAVTWATSSGRRRCLSARG